MDTHPAGPGLPHVRSGAVVLVHQSESSWTLLAGVSHVQVCYPHPPSCVVTAAPVHVTVNLNRLRVNACSESSILQTDGLEGYLCRSLAGLWKLNPGDRCTVRVLLKLT